MLQMRNLLRRHVQADRNRHPECSARMGGRLTGRPVVVISSREDGAGLVVDAANVARSFVERRLIAWIVGLVGCAHR
jgi:hypothetical protein